MRHFGSKRAIVFLLLFVALFLTPVYAHPGKTDSDGGHYDHSTGEYHYHHGYPAHQHTDGICPYDYRDNTSKGSHSSSGSTAHTQNPSKPATAGTKSKTSASQNTVSTPGDKQMATDIMDLAYTGFMYMLIPVFSLLIKRKYNLFEIICISFLSTLFGWGYFWWDAWSRGGSSSMFAALAWGLVDFFYLLKVTYSDE